MAQHSVIQMFDQAIQVETKTDYFKADSHVACHSHAVPLLFPQGFRTCLSHLICTLWACLIHTRHAMPMPCSDHAVLLKATARPSRWPCCAVALRRTARSDHGMASVNQTWPHCADQMGKTHSKPLASRHGRGTACCV